MQKIVQYLKEVVERGGSDLHVSPNSPPMMRIHGELAPLGRITLSSEDTHILLIDMLSEKQIEELEQRKNIDLAYEVPHAGYTQRFRCNLFYQKNGLDGVFRVIPREIPSLKDLNLPESLENLTRFSSGLVIVTGPTGSGKSTTISALLDITNSSYYKHIITIEDPIEYVHVNRLSLIHQRQVGLHTHSFHHALKSAMREDPDLILVGELRDMETVDLAITAASIGRLVFTTMHTSSTSKAIERIIEFYTQERQNSARMLLAECLRAIVAQQLIPRADGWGRIPAIEILINNQPVSNLIREIKTHQIISIIQTGRNLGMVSMDDYLVKLYEEGRITSISAYEYAVDKNRIDSVLRFSGRQK